MTSLEHAAHDLLRAALRLKDVYAQGCQVTADALDLVGRAEDVILPIGTSMTVGPVMETRPMEVAA